MHFAVQLLSPPVAENWGGNSNPLIGHAPMLYAALQGMNTADAMNVLSLFGMVLLKISHNLVRCTCYFQVVDFLADILLFLPFVSFLLGLRFN